MGPTRDCRWDAVPCTAGDSVFRLHKRILSNNDSKLWLRVTRLLRARGTHRGYDPHYHEQGPDRVQAGSEQVPIAVRTLRVRIAA